MNTICPAMAFLHAYTFCSALAHSWAVGKAVLDSVHNKSQLYVIGNYEYSFYAVAVAYSQTEKKPSNFAKIRSKYGEDMSSWAQSASNKSWIESAIEI